MCRQATNTYYLLSDYCMLSSRQWKGAYHTKGTFKDQQFSRKHFIYWVFFTLFSFSRTIRVITPLKTIPLLGLLRPHLSTYTLQCTFDPFKGLYLFASICRIFQWQIPSAYLNFLFCMETSGDSQKWSNNSFFNSIKTEPYWWVFHLYHTYGWRIYLHFNSLHLTF